MDRFPLGWRTPSLSGAAMAALTSCVAALSGCARTSEGAPARAAAAASSVADSPSVDLSPTQVDTIQVAPAGMYSFPVVKTEFGSVAFAEDPAIVQAESTLLGAAATLKLTRKELQRAHLLYGTQGVSAREVEQATSDEQTAAAALEAARVAL